MLWSKNFLGKERVRGVVTVPLKDLKKIKAGEEPPPADWYPVLYPQEKVLNAGGDIVISTPKESDDEDSSSSTTSSDDEEGAEKPKKESKDPKKKSKKKKSKKKKPGDKVGQLRMQVYICTPFVEKVVLPGIAYDGAWHDRMNGGNIVGNPFWAENPQYLLTVGCSTRVTITLAQPRDHNTQATFYVLHYDDSKFAGRRLPYFDKEDIIHVDDTEYLAPSFATRGLLLFILAHFFTPRCTHGMCCHARGGVHG